MIFEAPEAALAGSYPQRPFRLRHHLRDHRLFALPALLDLASRLPPESIEYNAGDIPIDQDPDKTPMTGLSIAETIRRIEEFNSWMVIHHVEQEPEYAAALEECLAEIAPSAAKTTGRMYKKMGFIFVSSPGAVTPLHLDPEHNILMQIGGAKRIHIYPADKGVVPAERHEEYHAGAAHRNLRHKPEFDALMEVYDLAPGDGVYVPVKAPHWVKNGDAPSISFSITWRSRASDNEARLRLANHAVRRLGGRPPEPGEAPLRDAAKIFAQRVVSKLKSASRS